MKKILVIVFCLLVGLFVFPLKSEAASLSCTGQYFGKSQCVSRTSSLTGGSCQLNSALGTINTTNLSDPVNYWKWSYCKSAFAVVSRPIAIPTGTLTFESSCIPASSSVSGCQLKGSYGRQCTKEYYQMLGQQCNPARTGMSLFNWYSCTCFYKETYYDCGGVMKAVYEPQYMPGANGYSSFSYYNYAPTCLSNSFGSRNGGGTFTNKSQCAAWCANR